MLFLPIEFPLCFPTAWFVFHVLTFLNSESYFSGSPIQRKCWILGRTNPNLLRSSTWFVQIRKIFHFIWRSDVGCKAIKTLTFVRVANWQLLCAAFFFYFSFEVFYSQWEANFAWFWITRSSEVIKCLEK